MRQIMDRRRVRLSRDRSREISAGHRVPSQPHPLLGRPAPAFELKDSTGKIWTLQETVGHEPVILVFYLGQTCMACVTHLVELDFAMPQFRERGARVLAISADSPELSRQRLHQFGDFQIPLLSDPDHSAALAYGVWKPLPGGNRDDGEPLHGTFIVDRRGSIRWATSATARSPRLEALLAELDAL